MKPNRESPQWKNYWVLYLDLAGVSLRVCDPDQRQELADVYSRFVDIAVLWAPPLTRKFQRKGLSLEDVALVRAGGVEVLGGRRDDYHTSMVKESLRIWSSRVRVFSDSVFVFFDCDVNRETETADHENLVETAGHMSSLLWQHGMPHKGSISYGECYLNGPVCLGQPLVEAAKWERAQEWLGVSVSPASKIAASRAGFVAHGLVQHEVGRSGAAEPESTYCVDVARFVSGVRNSDHASSETPSLPDVVEGLRRSALGANTATLRRRYQSTASFWKESLVNEDSAKKAVETLDEIIRSCAVDETK